MARFTSLFVVGGSVCFSLMMMDVFEQLKLTWIVLVPIAAPFWIGMFWRGATTAAAWVTVVFCAIVFFLIPWIAPLVSDGLSTNPAFTQVTPLVETTTTRIAAPTDVAQRQAAIRVWEEMQEQDIKQSSVASQRPKPLKLGDAVTITQFSGGYPIYWTGGVLPVDENGNVLADLKPLPTGAPEKTSDTTSRIVKRYDSTVRLKGMGNFRFDFLLYKILGIDLGEYSDSTLRTLDLPPKIIVPFLVMIVASLFTQKNSKTALDRYYVKMKTPVQRDPHEDREMLEHSYNEPSRFNYRKLWPNSNLEFQKPTRSDVVGFVLSVVACFGVIALAMLVANIGS